MEVDRLTGEASAAVALACGSCGVAAMAESAFCGACGAVLSRATRSGVSWRGPRRTVVAGALATTVGVVVVIASWLTVQISDSADVAQKVMSAGTGLLLSDGEVSAVADAAGISATAVAAFVLGAALTALGCCLLAAGTVWTIARWAPRRRARAGWRRAQPHVTRIGARLDDAQPTVKAIGRRGRTEASAGARRFAARARSARERMRRDER